MKIKTILTFGAAALVVSARGQSLITNVGALGANDQLNWSNLGPSQTTYSSPFNINSSLNNETINVSLLSNMTFLRLDQSNGWNGNFAPGEPLLYNQGFGDIYLSFSNPLNGVGFQIQADYPGSFTATISAFDANNVYLGSVSEAGNSTFTADNSAIFIGIETQNISKIMIDTQSGAGSNFVIGTTYLDVAPVPEPSTLALAGLGGVGLLAFRLRKLNLFKQQQIKTKP
jgi:hypothetical protein